MQDKLETAKNVRAPAVPALKAASIETWTSPLAGGMPIHFGEGAVDRLPELLL